MPNLLLGGPATTTAKGTDTHIGEGLPPIPSKLSAKFSEESSLRCMNSSKKSGSNRRRARSQPHEGQEEGLRLECVATKPCPRLYEGVLVPQSRELMACSQWSPSPRSDLPIISLSRKALQSALITRDTNVRKRGTICSWHTNIHKSQHCKRVCGWQNPWALCPVNTSQAAQGSKMPQGSACMGCIYWQL